MASQPAPASAIPKESVRVASESVGVELPDDVMKALCLDAEYRLREIIQVRSIRHHLGQYFNAYVPNILVSLRRS